MLPGAGQRLLPARPGARQLLPAQEGLRYVQSQSSPNPFLCLHPRLTGVCSTGHDPFLRQPPQFGGGHHPVRVQPVSRFLCCFFGSLRGRNFCESILVTVDPNGVLDPISPRQF